MRTKPGNNIKSMLADANLHNIENLSISHLKRNIQYKATAMEDKWKISIVRELLDIKMGAWHIPTFSAEQVDGILTYVCTE